MPAAGEQVGLLGELAPGGVRGRLTRHVEQARDGIRIYLYGTGAGAVLWLASLAVEGPVRYVLWAVGLLVDAAAPLLVTASRTSVPLHLEHLPDRFSLFVILVLGESVVTFTEEARAGLVYLRKMDAQLASKMRFVSSLKSTHSM